MFKLIIILLFLLQTDARGGRGGGGRGGGRGRGRGRSGMSGSYTYRGIFAGSGRGKSGTTQTTFTKDYRSDYPLYKYYLPPNYYNPVGYYSSLYLMVYYNGYGFNFYYGEYSYYEKSPTDLNIGEDLVIDIILVTMLIGVGLSVCLCITVGICECG